MADWTMIVFNSASISLNIYMLIRTWVHYWKQVRPYFYTNYTAPSILLEDGVHFVPYILLKILNEKRNNDRRYARAQLKSNRLFSLLWIGLTIFMFYNCTNI